MPTLKSTIEALADRFASDIVAAMRQASVAELLDMTTSRPLTAPELVAPNRIPPLLPASPAARRKGRLARRSTSEITGVVEGIVALLRKFPSGLRAEQIRAELGLDAKELPRPLSDALAAGYITKKGQKRSTVYSVSKRA